MRVLRSYHITNLVRVVDGFLPRELPNPKGGRLLKLRLYSSKRQGNDTREHLLESFEQTLPRYQLKKRLKDYVEYLNTSDIDSLAILFICANTADLLYAKRSVRKLTDDNNERQIRMTTLDKHISEHKQDKTSRK